MKNDQILDADIANPQGKPFHLIWLTLLLIGTGGFIGATTNLVNGNVSELYFQRIMGWNFPGIWKAAILQGIFEGFIYGFIFSIIYTIGFAIITKRKADWNFVKRQLTKMVKLIYLCWIIGGVIAIFLSVVFSDDYQRLIRGVPIESIQRIRYAWVGGSIWGALIGGIISLIWGLFNTYRDWKTEFNSLKIPNL